MADSFNNGAPGGSGQGAFGAVCVPITPAPPNVQARLGRVETPGKYPAVPNPDRLAVATHPCDMHGLRVSHSGVDGASPCRDPRSRHPCHDLQPGGGDRGRRHGGDGYHRHRDRSHRENGHRDRGRDHRDRHRRPSQRQMPWGPKPATNARLPVAAAAARRAKPRNTFRFRISAAMPPTNLLDPPPWRAAMSPTGSSLLAHSGRCRDAGQPIGRGSRSRKGPTPGLPRPPWAFIEAWRGGCSSMVERQPSKLLTGVRFPSPAPKLSESEHVVEREAPLPIVQPVIAKQAAGRVAHQHIPGRTRLAQAIAVEHEMRPNHR